MLEFTEDASITSDLRSIFKIVIFLSKMRLGTKAQLSWLIMETSLLIALLLTNKATPQLKPFTFQKEMA